MSCKGVAFIRLSQRTYTRLWAPMGEGRELGNILFGFPISIWQAQRLKYMQKISCYIKRLYRQGIGPQSQGSYHFLPSRYCLVCLLFFSHPLLQNPCNSSSSPPSYSSTVLTLFLFTSLGTYTSRQSLMDTSQSLSHQLLCCIMHALECSLFSLDTIS